MTRLRLLILPALLLAAGSASAHDMPSMPADMAASAPLAAVPPGHRQLVHFPPALERETLASMREHLEGLALVQQALAEARYDDAASIAARKLGMGSMREGQSREEARAMPAGMRALGARLHMQAGEFALAAQDAQATGDTARPARLLGQMMQTCVACHAAYRLR